jgi:hypothetical protein
VPSGFENPLKSPPFSSQPLTRGLACEASETSSADDRADVLGWRLDNATPRSSQDGPLPRLPGVPDRIAADPT